MAKIIKKGTFVLVQTNDGKLKTFSSLIDKMDFIQTRNSNGYEMLDPNHVIIHKYMVIDTEGEGWCLTPKKAVTLEEADQLIKMYL